MDALKIGIDWMTDLRDKYGQEKAMKIINGFSEVYAALERQDEDTRNHILSLFVEIGAQIMKKIP